MNCSGVALALGLVAALPATAHASVQVDWGRGLVIADAVGVADRHAPNPAVARGTSKRGAIEAAKKQLAAKLAELPVATGGDVGDAAKRDAAVEDRLAAAVAHAITLAADPETDGAWRVTLAVPIEAVRLALTGPRTLADAGDSGPQVVVVEGVTAKHAKPAVGYTLGTLAAPTLWVAEVPAWAKDAPRVTAKAAKAGVIEAPGITGTAATLFVLVTPR